MADRRLHERYMAADRAYREHTDTCVTCTPGSPCAEGARLYRAFAGLQDDYLRWQRSRRSS